MAVTVRTPGERRPAGVLNAARNVELALLAAAALLVFAGLGQVRSSKDKLLAQGADGLAAGRILDLNQTVTPDRLTPALEALRGQPEDDQRLAREKLAAWLNQQPKPLSNVGRLSALRVNEQDLARYPRSEYYRRQFATIRQRREQREADLSWWERWVRRFQEPKIDSVRLLNAGALAATKPFLIVRRQETFEGLLRRSALLFFVPFLLAHGWFRFRRFQGDPFVLPALLLFTGIGLIYLLSLRDPLRDTTQWEDFSLGVLGGVALLAVFATVDVASQTRRLYGIPLGLAAALFLALLAFGSGPGGSGVKVNLFGIQPIEAIKILLGFFLAGYLGSEWEKLRHLGGSRANWLSLPRPRDLLPLAVCLAVSLAFLLLAGDLGPALVLSLTFLAVYCVTRRVAAPAILLVSALGGALWAVHRFRTPEYVAGRIDMWIDPWRVPLGKSMQLANSLWALASGGWRGTGFGFGMPEAIEAAHTDMVLAGIGEELGFIGLAVLFGLYFLLFSRFLAIARRGDAYAFFLGTTLTLLLTAQLLLIAAGTLGLMPLSGVVAPFLSYGRSSMLANFAVAGILLSLSNRPAGQAEAEFRRQARILTGTLAVCGVLLLARAAWIQLYLPDDRMAQPVALEQWRTEDPDERLELTARFGPAFRPVPNPRLVRMAREIPRGTVSDRNLLPLASSNLALVEEKKPALLALGVRAAALAPAPGGLRVYPFGTSAYYLLSDAEQFAETTLRGYGSLRELVPLWRHQLDPKAPAVRAILDKPRDLRLSIDMRFQLAAARALQQRAPGKKAAAVLVDPGTGEILALASQPLPAMLPGDPTASAQTAPTGANLARTGLYPPGSSFKLVTAIAALRKDPGLAATTHNCEPIEPRRVGKVFRHEGRRYTIRDFPGDPAHGDPGMKEALVVSCNAYFAQLGAFEIGPERFRQTAALFGISVDAPDRGDPLEVDLPRAAYGQGEVIVTPLQMARVAGAIAADGMLAPSRFILTETPPESAARVVGVESAAFLQGAMREVVKRGTAASRTLSALEIAGKTGTAQWKRKATDHAWFVGYAPVEDRRVAFAILVAEGGGGGRTAAPISGEIIAALKKTR